MTETRPYLSIVVPAYNVEEYLPQCAESILGQTFQDFELLLVDDGSTDATGALCDKYAATDCRVRTIHKKNGGLVSARKAGLSEAAGKYVAYVDGDDWVAETMFEELSRKAMETGADIVISDFVAAGKTQENLSQNMDGGFYDKEALNGKVYPEMLSKGDYFSFGFQPSLCSRLFRRELLQKYQMKVDDSIRLGEDAACSYACLLEAESIYYLKEGFFYFYRMRESSISHAIIKTYYTDEIVTLGNLLQREFEAYPEKKEVLMPQLYRYLCYMLDNMITPHISLKELFLTGEMKKQLQHFEETQLGKETVHFCRQERTSSRMKRILRLAEENSTGAALNLYGFRKYEQWRGGCTK